MKLTNYAPTVQPNTISGRGNPVSNPSDPRAWGADVSGINALGNAVGIGLKMAEDDMTADVTNAMNEYNKRIDDLMYNQDNGLAYLKNENARNVTQLYQEGEKKIRDEVFKMVPKYKKAQDLFIQKANASTIAGIEDTQKQAYREAQNYKTAVMNDTIETSQIAISHNYTKPQFVQNELSNIRNAIWANGKDYGAQWCKDKTEEVMGKTVGDALSQAFADNDMQAVDNLVNRFGPLINPAYIRQFVAKNNAQKEQNFMITQSQSLAQQFRKDPKGLRDYISKMQIDEPSTGNWGAQIASSLVDKYVGKPSYLADIGGTTCVYWPTVAAHELNPDIPIMTNTTQLKEFGREKGIWHAGPDAIKDLQPGDMIILNSPAEEEAHNTVWTGTGIYNSGGSGGSAYTEQLAQDPSSIASFFGEGWSIAGVVSMSQLQGGGMGPAKKRALSPAEQEKLYAATQREINILDAQDRKVKQEALQALKNQLGDLVINHVTDRSQYESVVQRFIGTGGLESGDVATLANSYYNAGLAAAGLTRSGRSRGGSGGMTAAEKREQKAAWAEQIADGTVNQTQAETALTLMGIPKGSSEFNSYMKMWSVASTGDINMSLLKQRWKNEGHSAEDFKYAVPYMMNYIVGERQAGRQVSQGDAYDALVAGEEPVEIDVGEAGDERRQVKKNALYNGFGIYNRDESNGMSYAENVDEPFYLSDKEIDDTIGSVPIEEDD